MGPFGTLYCEDALESVEPFRGFERIDVELAVHLEVGMLRETAPEQRG